MQRYRWRVIAWSLAVLLAALGWVVFLYVRAPLQYSVIFPGIRKLPPDVIDEAFLLITGRQLPAYTYDLQGTMRGGRYPAIFVRFHTNPEGIAHIVDAFGGPGVASMAVDPNSHYIVTPRGAILCLSFSKWEERLKMPLFDRGTVRSGRVLEYLREPGGQDGSLGGYKILIDDENAIVYVLLWHI